VHRALTAYIFQKILKQKVFIIVLNSLGLSVPLVAQDTQFTQFFAAPLYHNPAFTGANLNGRLASSYRNQWPALEGSFTSSLFTFDIHSHKENSGFGLLIANDNAGVTRLRSTQVGALYAYRTALSQKWRLSAGTNMSIGNRHLNFNKLLFGDQLVQEGRIGASLDPLKTATESKTYLDLSGGLLAYTQRMWVAFSAAHINRPNQGFGERIQRLPIRYMLTAGLQIPIDDQTLMGIHQKPRVLTPAALFKQQGSFRQVDLGCYINYNPLLLGVWYRGLPVIQSVQGAFNHDAISAMLGLQQDNLTIGYSYDINLSGIAPIYSGSHEISVTYEFRTEALKRQTGPKTRGLPCPSL
jgi:type IX secretion system PorP/SprF family membrane protein